MLLMFRGMGTASRVDESQFMTMMLSLLKLRSTEQSKTFCRRIFRIFDVDDGGTVSWQEFLDSVYLLCRGLRACEHKVGPRA